MPSSCKILDYKFDLPVCRSPDFLPELSLESFVIKSLALNPGISIK